MNGFKARLGMQARRWAVAATALATGAAGLALLVGTPSPAEAATSPVATRTPAMVTADALPTAQINGVAWSQAVVGNTVYVGGSFTDARPPGAAAGTNTVPRTHLLSYDIRTGQLTSFAPSLNAQVLEVAASPDGTRLYAVGDFTTANGVRHNRIAAFSTATGQVISTFTPNVDAKVKTVYATNSTVYVGGIFSTANGQPRSRVAAFNAADGSVTGWNPAADATVNAVTGTPDDSKIIIGGAFQNAGGAAAYGLAATDPATGALLPWNAVNLIRNAGPDAAILSLTSDDSAVYGTAYHFGAGGNLEGTFKADAATGDIEWVEDCHGDTYEAYAGSAAVYNVGHAHYCGNIGGFPQTDPTWTYHRALAFTKGATGTIDHDTKGYFDFFGNPSPSLVNWFPDLPNGSYTGQNQGSWAVTGNDQYVVVGGEFPSVNGTAQQGLVRFGVPSVATNQQGPRLSGSRFVPSVRSFTAGTARVAFGANWDRDDTDLTYRVVRDNDTASPVYTTTVASTFWKLPGIGFTDTGLTPGQTYRYRVYAVDPDGNQVVGDNVSVTVATGGTLSSYAQDVIADGASHYWRLDEETGNPVGYDWAGFEDLTVAAGVTRGATGAIAGDTNRASTFDGTGNGLAVDATATAGPDVFTQEAWFKTTTTSGGKIVGFGNAATGESSNYDRHLYMSPSGQVWFGVYNNGSYTVNTPTSYNDGTWHHAVGTMGPSGLTLYVDGRKIGSNGGTSVAQPYTGYWRVGGDSAWDGAPYFDGSIDDVAIYPTVLTKAQVQAHYAHAGGTLPPGSVAPADAYGKAVYDDGPDAYYRLDETSGTTATDVSGNGNDGVYSGGVTVGVTSPVTGGTGLATAFGGSDGSLGSGIRQNGPTVYSEELWFQTTTTRGGKLIGFGNEQSGYSSNYDRHVYMEDSGQLTFGVWTGQTNTATSPAAYNDGQWHHLVASQGSDGMKLYVDKQLVATNPQTAQQGYDGYWRIGGDTAWGGSSSFFDGTIDEVAVYSSVLSQTQINAHFAKALVNTVNHAPSAVITSATPSGLAVDVDGSGSSDPDGDALTYAWDFGDGASDTGATAHHVYAAAGTYLVALTVSDPGNATDTTTQLVTVSVPNQAPTAAFAISKTDLVVATDASASGDPDGTIAGYAWNWGDSSTSDGVTATHTYAAAGTYTVTLTVTDDDGAVGTVSHPVTVTAANQAPHAAFTSTTSELTASFDASASNDPDGTVASYAWTFGDGQSGTGPTPTHPYAAAGTYAVTLTVTDAGGLLDTVTHDVVVSRTNARPTAAFTSTTTGLTADLDASGSGDPDGTIASYAWDFGDSSFGTGRTPVHAYAAAGTYPVTLRVTDNDGATDSVTQDVTVSVASTRFAQDDFGRVLTNGWGVADRGGTWTPLVSTTTLSVNGTSGVATTAAGGKSGAYLGGVSRTDADVSATVSVDRLSNGNGTYVYVVGRRVSANTEYRGRVRLLSTGSVRLALTRVDNAASDTTIGTEVTLAGVTYAPGDKLQTRLQTTGTSPTTLRFKVWRAGQSEPTGWQLTGTDTTARLQAVGSVGLRTYLTGTAVNGPANVAFAAFSAQPTSQVNMRPTASFTHTESGLRVSVNGSGSTDPDGSVVGYEWTFGDGASASTVSAEHVYAAAGTYPVTLTVRDDSGAVDSVTASVTVAPAANQAPSPAFATSATGLVASVDATGSTDADGTIASYAWDFGDGTAGTGRTTSHTYAAGGTYNIRLTVTDDDGAPATLVKPVTVSIVTAFASDDFGRTLASGWGTADLGGAWTLSGAAANFGVNGSAATLRMPTAGSGPSAYLNAVNALNVDGTVDVRLDSVPTGGGTSLAFIARRQAGSDYRVGVKLTPTGTNLQLIRTAGGTATTLRNLAVAGLTYQSGDVLRIRLQVSGSGTSTLSAKVWKVGAAEPATWQVTATDATAALQSPGGVGLNAYLSGSATTAPVTAAFDRLRVESINP